MLEVKYVDDRAELENICLALGVSPRADGMNAVLFADNEIAGLCRLRLEQDILFDEFILGKDYNTFENVDFFFRAVLFKLTKTGMDIRINAVDDRLLKFGFVKRDGSMTVYSENIKFPSQCGI